MDVFENILEKEFQSSLWSWKTNLVYGPSPVQFRLGTSEITSVLEYFVICLSSSEITSVLEYFVICLSSLHK